MASVWKREWTHKGVTKSAWCVDYDFEGKRRRETFKSKKDADAFKRKVEREIDDGLHTPNRDSPTVESVCDEFMRYQEERVRRKVIGRPRLKQIALSVKYDIIPFLGKKRFNQLEWSDIEGWQRWLLNERKLHPATADLRMNVLAFMEPFARKRNYTKRTVINDAIKDLSGAQYDEIERLSADQMQTLLSVVAERRKGQNHRSALFIRCAVHLAAFCGLRLGEVFALGVSSIDFDGRRVQVRRSLNALGELKGPKTKAGIRDVPMPSHVAELLREWVESFYIENEDELLFTSMNGRPLDHGNYHINYWYPVLKAAGFKTDDKGKTIHFHALRHFFGSWLIRQGMPITTVAAVLGHSTPAMTLRVYAREVEALADRYDDFERCAAQLFPAERYKSATTPPNPLMQIEARN